MFYYAILNHAFQSLSGNNYTKGFVTDIGFLEFFRVKCIKMVKFPFFKPRIVIRGGQGVRPGVSCASLETPNI